MCKEYACGGQSLYEMKNRFGIDVDTRMQTRLAEIVPSVLQEAFKGKKNGELRQAYEHHISIADDESSKTSMW